MTTFLFAVFIGFLCLFAGAYLGRVDDDEPFDCNQCETEECDPNCDYQGRVG